MPVAQRAYRHREQRGVDSGEATEGSPKGCPRWRQRSHTGIDSSDNRVFAGMNPLKRVAFQRESALGRVNTTGILFAGKENDPFMKGAYSYGT